MNASIPRKALILGILVLLAGCSGAVSDPGDEDFEERLSITEPVDRDDDGKYSTFKITSKSERLLPNLMKKLSEV